MADQTGDTSLRTQFFDKTVKGFATATYKFKQALAIVSTSAWINYFWRETPTALSSPATNNIKGIPRGAEFPQASVEWTRVQTVIEKYGLEDTIAWEDILADDVDVRNRTLFRIAEGVAKSVDDEIWDVLTESQTPVNIQSVTIANGYQWDTASAAIFKDLGEAKRLIGTSNYPTNDLICFISPQSQKDIDSYIFEKGAQAPSMGNAAALNGSIGKVNGVNFVVSNSVTASFALVVVPKRVGTWKSLVPLSTTTTERKFKDLTITSVELGITQLTDPKAAVLIVDTQA